MKYNLMQNCPKLPLVDLLEFIVDNRGKTVPTSDGAHVLIATNCIKNTELYPVFEKVRYLDESTYNNWFRAHPKPGDIIFVNKGTPGRVCMVPNPVNFCIAQDMIALRAKKEIIYNKYLFAVLRSSAIQKQIYNTNVGDVIPHFKKSFLNQLYIPVPAMHTQKEIGDIYFELSKKIDLNNRINKNLEAQAQAIFKSWFVDFEPFQDGKFVDSELGQIPKGWKVGTIANLGDIVGGSTPSKTKPEYYTDKGIAWLTPKDLSIQKNKYIFHGQTDITELGLKNSSARLMPKGTVLFSSRAPIGYMAIAGNEVSTNQGFKSIVPFSHIGTPYVYFYLKTNLERIESSASGSTFREVSGSTMKNISALIPCNNALIQFTQLCDPIFLQQQKLEQQNQTLSNLRDTLLPKLMSGEIQIPQEV